MSEIAIIVSPGNETGFELAGFDTIVIENTDPGETLSEAARNKNIGLVCIEEKLYLKVKKEIVDRIRKKGIPVIMPLHIPETFEDTGAREGHIARLIRRTIGYQVKLKK